MDVPIHITRTKHETATELKWIFSKSVLLMPRFSCVFSRCCIVFAKNVQYRRPLELCSLVSASVLIDQQRKRDAGFLAKTSSIIHVAEAYGCEARSLRGERLLIRAQLSNVFATEDSAIVTQEDDDRRAVFPQGT